MLFFVSDTECILVSHILTAAGLHSAVSELDDHYWLFVEFSCGSYVSHVDSGKSDVCLFIVLMCCFDRVLEGYDF